MKSLNRLGLITGFMLAWSTAGNASVSYSGGQVVELNGYQGCQGQARVNEIRNGLEVEFHGNKKCHYVSYVASDDVVQKTEEGEDSVEYTSPLAGYHSVLVTLHSRSGKHQSTFYISWNTSGASRGQVAALHQCGRDGQVKLTHRENGGLKIKISGAKWCDQYKILLSSQRYDFPIHAEFEGDGSVIYIPASELSKYRDNFLYVEISNYTGTIKDEVFFDAGIP